MMQLFLDSADLNEIRDAREWAMIDGVTTNPSLIAREGRSMEATLRRVIDASPGPVLCQVIGSDDRIAMVAQARWLHRYSEKIVVKLPMSRAGLQAVTDLKKEESEMPIAVTVISSVAQAYLAAKAGADIVALFNGPLDQTLDQQVELVAPVRRVFDNYGFATKILSCGRYPPSFGSFVAAGTDICTLRYEYLSLLFEHPYTDKRIRGFQEDWQRVFGNTTWPTREN